MRDAYLIGLDYGSESARGVLVNASTGIQEAYHTHPYRHGVITGRMPQGQPLPPDYALQDPSDYLEAAEDILARIGRGRDVMGIGIDFTASSPMPALADGRALSVEAADDPHAYVKLWKHAAAQPYADAINRAGGAFLANFGNGVSGEWLLAKAAQIRSEAPHIWTKTDRFIEAGDWLVWQLTGMEVRSLDFAAYKAQYSDAAGYPAQAVPGLGDKLRPPKQVGSPAGPLSAIWRERTGVGGAATVAVAVIDSHAILPAVGAISTGSIVGALGTSAVYLLLDDAEQPMPAGIEGRALGAALPGLWCYEAGQAGFGDVLAWFVRTFSRADDPAESFRRYNKEAAALPPGKSGLIALDWWNGNRVPFANKNLSGLIVGLNLSTTAAEVYRSLLESLCFGARSILYQFLAGGFPIERIILSSGLARNNPLLVQTMADVIGRPIHVPMLDNPTAVGAAIHGAVAAGVVSSFAEGAARFGAREFETYPPELEVVPLCDELYTQFRELSVDETIRKVMLALHSQRGERHEPP